MRCENGFPPSFEVALGFVKTTNEHGLFSSQVKHHGHGSMPGGLDDGDPHLGGVFVEIVFGKTQAF